MKTINLEEIIIKRFGCTDTEDLKRCLPAFITVDNMKDCMKDACEQTVDLCKEKIINASFDLGEALTSNQMSAIENTKKQIV